MRRGSGPVPDSTAESPAARGMVEIAEDPLLTGPDRSLAVVLVGASGFIGRHLLERLASRGHRVRAVSRRGRPADVPGSFDVSWIAADVRRESAVRGLARDCDVVVHAAGIRREREDETFRAVHVEATDLLVAHAASAGVERFVYLSALGAGESEDPFFRTKLQGEHVVRASAIDSVIFRPSVVFGAEDHFTHPLVRWLESWPVCVVRSGGDDVFQPVAVEDVTDALCQAVERSDVAGGTYPLVGPERLTMAEVVDAVAAARGLDARVFALPSPLGESLAGMMRSLARARGRPTEGWDTLRRWSRVRPSSEVTAFRAVFHILPMPFRETLEDYL